MPCPKITAHNVSCPENCPAQNLKNLTGYGRQGAFYLNGTNWSNWVNYCEDLRRRECDLILNRHGQINLYILTESIPYGRFVYDPQSNYYRSTGLRIQLCRELINANCPSNINHCNQCLHFNQLLDYLRNKGILIVDCALCPLHRLQRYRDRRLAATLCLNNNTRVYLNVTPNAPIVTIFPSNCGFHKSRKPHVQNRVKRKFRFSNVEGLKDTIEELLGDC